VSGATPQAKVVRLGDASPSEITGDGARGVVGLSLLELDEGTGAFDFRAVRIRAGGISSEHAHPWEQANFILAGRGVVELDGRAHDVAEDDFVYVPPDVRHVFRNTGTDDLVILAARGRRV
jgi:quercetin dioxygenase-like cupin family protein